LTHSRNFVRFDTTRLVCAINWIVIPVERRLQWQGTLRSDDVAILLRHKVSMTTAQVTDVLLLVCSQ